MNTLRWERAKELFDVVLDLKPEERSNYLQQSCGEDVELRREVEDLLAADAEAGSFMNPGWLAPFSPFRPEPEFELAPGDVVSGRFKIVRPLGDGGMGRVYEAHDSVLGVQVALKTLRPEISANPEVLFRFRQEVRIAHRITHPNVCRTYHLDHELRRTGADESSSVDLTFLTMEFLEGETLQQLLRRSGRLQPARALAIARQMAEAIEAAHQIGIVHRDIKPSNVMICPASAGDEAAARVVMTDFGLAKFEAGAPNNDLTSISQPGRAMGTLSYMSPEQLKGGEVSCLTDIYAFGLVLYEMVTGVKAFPDSSTMETAYRRTVEPPPSPRTLFPDVPREWETAVLGCLQIEPAGRFQHAMDAVAILEGSEPYSSRLRLLQRPTPVQRRRLRRRVALIAAGCVAGVALSAIGLRYFMARGDSAVAAGALVYLAPVKNETGEKQLDNVTELVRAGLEQSAHINLLDAGRVGDILQQMTKPPGAVIDEPTAREIAMRAGAARIIYASVTGSKGSYDLKVEIERPDSSPLRARRRSKQGFTWRSAMTADRTNSIPAELSMTIREASDWVRSKVGESKNDIAQLDTPPEDVTTNSWEALEEYQRSVRLNAAQQPAEAVEALEKAIHIDPGFALAYGMLADVQMTLHHEDEAFAAYKKALDPGLERRLSRRERDRIEGMYAVDSWDFAAAVDAFRDYRIFYPADRVGWLYPTHPLEMMGRNDEAIANVHHAVELDPASTHTQILLGYAYLEAGNLQEAERVQARVMRQQATGGTLALEGTIAFLTGKYDRAKELFVSLKETSEPRRRSRDFEMLADLAAEQGNFSEALELLDEGIHEDATQGNTRAQSAKLAGRAWMEAKLGNFDGCIADLQTATMGDPAPEFLMLVETILGQAIEAAPVAKKALLRRQMVAVSRRPPVGDYGVITHLLAMRNRAEDALADGDAIKALPRFRQLAAIDAPSSPKEYLGRALAAAAAETAGRQPRSLAAAALWKESANAYAETALHPGVVWDSPYSYPPGFWADELQSYVRAAEESGAPSQEELRDARTRLLSLRGAKSKLSAKAIQ